MYVHYQDISPIHKQHALSEKQCHGQLTKVT